MAEQEKTSKLQLHHLKPAPGSKKTKIRVGRGEGGRRGKTAGRGTKGLNARSKLRPGFEGGQTPLARRLPKLRGFTNPNKEYFAVINVERLNGFRAGSTITPDDLRDRGLIKKRGRVKVLAEGDLDKSLTVRAHVFSKEAAAKIEAAGGTAEVIAE
uniref:Large ribosomal subunit protein uL15 n=1 Tax=uncultured actinobacterium Rifle_16ft_4_minimus_3564 TaxID=1665147 RepID=A0A0H4T3D8_9ACTN|nr:50S ribosomal protein L15, large subunit ribosomal protein L15 [uncultured actinobacterium Rifle_16ft_4_minimus_3564]